MWTITVTVANLVAAVSSVELDKYRYHSTAVFLLYAVSRVPLRAESKFSTGTRQYMYGTTKYDLAGWACAAMVRRPSAWPPSTMPSKFWITGRLATKFGT